MPDSPGSHKKNPLTVESSYDEPKLVVEGEQIQVSRDPDSGTFAAPALPYREFESIEDLAKAIAESKR